jgi:hypothetical protein
MGRERPREGGRKKKTGFAATGSEFASAAVKYKIAKRKAQAQARQKLQLGDSSAYSAQTAALRAATAALAPVQAAALEEEDEDDDDEEEEEPDRGCAAPGGCHHGRTRQR